MATTFDTIHVSELYVAGQRVEGGAALAALSLTAAPGVPDSEATNTRALVADFNALLAALRAAGVLAEVQP